MGIIVVLVFLGVFAVVALLMMATSSGSEREAKQVIATLDSALATETPEAREAIVDLRKDEVFSGIPWLNKKLLNFQLAPALYRLLNQADLKWTIGALMAMCLACFTFPAYAVWLKSRSVLIALGVGLLMGFIPIGYARWKRSKRFNKFLEGLPEALDLMVSALRAGHSLIAAMGLVARELNPPVGAEFKICFEEQNYGLEIKTALDNMIERVPLQDLRIVATAIMIQKESGGNLAEVLDKTGHVIRERFRLKRQIMVHTAQGRLTGWILTCLPIFLGIALYFLNPDMMSLLWTRPLGIKLIWTACGMIVLGGLIIRQIVNMDVY
ncbi:MAG: type II secretion system F family protein [Terracidiphilus sp.]|jgi:tight adherence protein B